MNAQQFKIQILSHSDRLYRMARSILKDDEKSKDAYQELIVRLWEKRNQLGNIDNPSAFSLTAMRNLCLDLLRKQCENGTMPLHAEYNAPNPHQLLEQDESIKAIRQMIDRLPELQRTIVRLRDVEEMEIGEIAAMLQMTPNAITVNLSRARKKLRETILTNQKKEEMRHDQHR